MIGGICNHLSKDQELQQYLRDNPDKIPAAVEEFVRLYSPYRGFARTVSKEIELHGQTIKPGIPLTITYCSANRDPAVFDDPHKFILDRPNITMHMGFGRGRHRCVGQPLATL
jgi:cytochrome P450